MLLMLTLIRFKKKHLYFLTMMNLKDTMGQFVKYQSLLETHHHRHLL
ncbi:hypothetical protein CSC12_1634 [Klebsiella michiganensis]|nr:hypothetical protein CSC12_1634 [Klebsiella michiganensis]